ncbi:BC1881 family protein [Bacillus thuringiensis]|uniref:BC1881 family protein n=1 Tax=Bacillus thuringiensis TaxID=1428 RepID=UPI00119EC6E6|nr:BC1881 family protein [Bacillus thuringiensis]
MNQKYIATQDLSKELSKREEVMAIHVEAYEKIEVGGVVVDGPARIHICKE